MALTAANIRPAKIVGWCRSAPRRRQVERDDPNLLEVDQI
jgi:hypothetical protein